MPCQALWVQEMAGAQQAAAVLGPRHPERLGDHMLLWTYVKGYVRATCPGAPCI